MHLRTLAQQTDNNMKKLVWIFTLLPICLMAQPQSEGMVVYQDIMKLDIQLPEGMNAEEMGIPKERKVMQQLEFSPLASLYTKYEDASKESNAGDVGGGNRRMRWIMRMAAASNARIYKNLEESRKVEEREFMDKMFLIKDSLDQYTWKLTGEQKQLGQWMVMKATTTEMVRNPARFRRRFGAPAANESEEPDEIEIITEAWFTPMIPVSSGPANYGGLPGLILEMKIGDNRVIRATTIEMKAIDEKTLAEPKKGKEVTEEEYREIMREKMMEMRAQQGGGRSKGTVIIRN